MKWSFRRNAALAGVAALLFAVAPLGAQEGAVEGTVTNSATGDPIAGAQITIEGTQLGTLSNSEGAFSIQNVPAGERVVGAQLIGYGAAERSVTVTAGQTATVSFALAQAAIELEGLIVTALGETRQKRALGYAAQDLAGDEIAEVQEPNIVSALSGRISGVNVISGGPQGGSARIVIRGASSIAGNNQPLFVVDGVPIDNSAPRNRGYGGVDYGNATQDVNSNDVESITVLKGPNAAALYGSRAANGAIIITTKSGRGLSEPRITFNSTVSWETPLKLPSYQNQYGQGSGGEFEFVDGTGSGTNDGTDESWGPACDGRPITQFFSGGEPAPFVCYPDNVSGFFETGNTVTNNLSFATGGESANVRLSVSDLSQNAMYPGQQTDRTTVALSGGANFSDRLRADASVNYITSGGDNRTGTGYNGSNPMLQYVWFGRSVDTNLLRDYKLEDTPTGFGGTAYNWNYNYHANPYWISFENQNWDDRNRIIGNLSLNYRFTPWLSATLRSGADWYRDDRKRTYAVGFIDFPEGAFAEEQSYRNETNSELLVTANRELTPALSLELTGGANRRSNEYEFTGTSVGQLSAPGIYTVDNAAVTPVTNDYLEEKRVNSLYGAGRLGFRDYLFVDVTGRNDWSSTLPEGNNSYFYPSVSGSFVFTDALPVDFGPLSFGKLRASWARVGNDADPYQLASVYSRGTPWSGIPGFSVPNVIPNANLKPEETESWELGTDLSLFNDRAAFELTYYDAITRNQILSTSISAASGFTERVLNAGAVSNKGWEALLSVVPLELDNGLRWELTANYSRNDNLVEELYGDLETVILAGGSGTYWGVTNEARVGEPYGTLRGIGFVRDDVSEDHPFGDKGNIVVGANGIPLYNPNNIVILGNYAPDWVGGLRNQLSYQGLDFSMLFDVRQGGEIFSVTNMFGKYTGVLEETLEGREDGPCDPGRVFPGVKQDGTPNDVAACPESFKVYLGYLIKEANIYDASYVKMREARLAYSLPDSWMARLPFSRMTVALVGRNLFLWDNIPHIDPESAFDASNVQGFEFGQLPTPRSFGVNFTIQP
ncbi:MAG: SusC/RagA family TonB-linked outer membrane protein [Longimicrobiaceae bacterium]